MNNILIANNADMTEVLDYAINDVIILDELFTKTNMIGKTIAYAQMCKTSIMDAFHKTDASMETQLLHVECFKNNKQLRFGFDQKELPIKYQGAANYNLNDNKVHNMVIDGDYSSMYPAAMLHYQLCLTRYRGHSTELWDDYKKYDVVKLNDKAYPDIKFLYLAKDVKGIVCETVKSILNKKNDCDTQIKLFKKSHDENNLYIQEAFRYGFKKGINTIYGLSGGSKQPIFCLPIAIAVTCTGRKVFNSTLAIIENELGGTVVFGDTDSNMMTFNTSENYARDTYSLIKSRNSKRRSSSVPWK